eukprot:3890678-Pleurochrysis_carterae.AAC.1
MRQFQVIRGALHLRSQPYRGHAARARQTGPLRDRSAAPVHLAGTPPALYAVFALLHSTWDAQAQMCMQLRHACD